MDNQDLYRPIFYQSYNVNQITNYTIIGERHSGTNWLEKIISSRLYLDITWNCGAKHFIYPDLNTLVKSDSILFICITRNIYDWIGGLFKIPHHVDKNLTLNLDEFLLSQWKSDIPDHHYITNEPYKNIFDLRKSKLEHMYISLPLIVGNLIITRYEDLCIDPEVFVSHVSNLFGIQKTEYPYYAATKPRIRASYFFEPDKIKIINDNTDWVVENYFRYKPKETA